MFKKSLKYQPKHIHPVSEKKPEILGKMLRFSLAENISLDS